LVGRAYFRMVTPEFSYTCTGPQPEIDEWSKVVQSTIDYFTDLMAANDPAEVEASMLTCQEKINGFRTEQTFLKVLPLPGVL
jgi:hypothetical protein